MGHAAASSAGRSDGAWTDNDERRSRANYAWQHPGRGKSAGEQAPGAAHARSDPFANRRSRAAPSTTDHFAMYAGRAQRVRHSQQARAAGGLGSNLHGTSYAGPHTGSHYQAGTSVFGAAKAAEESRLINDSSTIRSGQVRSVPLDRLDLCLPWLTSCPFFFFFFFLTRFPRSLGNQVAFVFLAVFLIAYSFRHEEQDKPATRPTR